MTVTEFLKQSVPFLAGLTEDQAHFLAKSAEQLVYRKGQTVIFRGVTVDGLHVVANGKVTVHAKVGKEFQQVAELGPGDVFGETSIIEMTVAGPCDGMVWASERTKTHLSATAAMRGRCSEIW